MRKYLFMATVGVACLRLLVPPAAAARAATTAGAAAAVPATEVLQAVSGSGSLVPDGKGGRVFKLDAPAARVPNPTVSSNGIFYHGGPVLLGTTHVYFIWYGNWAASSAIPILEDWAKTLGGSSYFNVNTTYFDGSNRNVSNSVTFNGAAFDNYSQGMMLDDGSIYTIVATATGNGSLPLDANAVYFVLTSADVAETTGFCTRYCGWHTADTFGSVVTQYAFVGNTAACPSACEDRPGNDPNGNEGADGMASIMTHELNESVTDPQGDAWYDNSGNEASDLCNFKFGPNQYTTANGSTANIQLGTRNFLLQQEWINAGGGSCTMSLAQNMSYYTVPPCRLIDTRNPAGPTGGPALQPGTARTFTLGGACGIPATARALSVNVTITGPAAAGFLALTAADQQAGGTSTINFGAGTTLTNNDVLRLSSEGTGSIAVVDGSPGGVHLILDVTGYFQ